MGSAVVFLHTNGYICLETGLPLRICLIGSELLATKELYIGDRNTNVMISTHVTDTCVTISYIPCAVRKRLVENAQLGELSSFPASSPPLKLNVR